MPFVKTDEKEINIEMHTCEYCQLNWYDIYTEVKYRFFVISYAKLMMSYHSVILCRL